MFKPSWLITIGLCASASVAHAHISIEGGGTHMSRAGDGELKDGPCGTANAPRSTNVHTYRPGETINITIAETIPHGGYFRIAFDDDGVDGFQDPSGTDGMNGNCAGDPNCGPGNEDYCNNEHVLLDHLDQHAPGFGDTYTWSVTLPNIECTNCTLQIIQIMNDLNIHPPAWPAGDIYYTCIDLVLSASAPEVNDLPVMNDGMVCPNSIGGDAGAGGMTMAGVGGVSVGGMTGGGIGGMMMGLAGAAGVGGVTMGGAGAPGVAGGVAQPTPAGSPGAAGIGTAGATGAPVGLPTAGMAVPITPTGSNNESSGGCSAGQPALAATPSAALIALALAWTSRRRRARA